MTVALAITSVAACGGGLEEQASVTWPESATVPVLAVDSGGGLPPPDPAPARFSKVPDFVLYGDGTAIWQGEEGFRSAHLDTKGVRTVLGWADDAGLLARGGVDTGEPEIYDVGSASFQITTDAGTESTQVYAPGFEDQGVGLSAEEIEARARIEAFRRRLFELPTALPENQFLEGEGSFDAPGWELLTRPSTSYDQVAGDEPEWTFDDPSVVGRCRVVTGVDEARIETEAGSSPEGHIWALNGEPWMVVARPLLPGAPAPCPGGHETP